MRILAFETASPSGGVALLVNGAIVGELKLNNAQAHSRHCLGFAETLLETQKLRWENIDFFATSHGPGAFTGVRVGLTIVKGLAWSLGKPCVTVSSLEALALHASAGEKVSHVVPLLDARSGEVYAAIFALKDGRLHRESDDFVGKVEDVAKRIPAGSLLAGEGARRHFAGPLAACGLLARADRILPTASAVAVLAAEKAARGETTAPGDLAAIYLREATTTQPKG